MTATKRPACVTDLTLDTKQKQLSFDLSLVQFSSLCSSFGMVMSILCYCVVEVWGLLFHFDFIRDCSWETARNSEETSDF